MKRPAFEYHVGGLAAGNCLQDSDSLIFISEVIEARRNGWGFLVYDRDGVVYCNHHAARFFGLSPAGAKSFREWPAQAKAQFWSVADQLIGDDVFLGVVNGCRGYFHPKRNQRFKFLTIIPSQ